MSIDIKNIKSVKIVKKPWGYERWIADGAPNFKYALKEIFFRASHKSSIQFHEFKEETNYVQKGKGILYYSKETIDIKKFRSNGYSENELKKIINNLQKQELLPGMIVHVKPRCIHRIEAIEDLSLIESSTIELDDVYRINDEWGRSHGKIINEHFEKMKIEYVSKEKIALILFSNNLVSGKVLDFSYGKFMSYFNAKTFLEKHASEVWFHDVLDDEEKYVRRKHSTNNSIEFEIINTKMPNKSFDCIISFDAIQYVKNYFNTIKFFEQILTDDGILIIATSNKNSSISKKMNKNHISKGLTKEEFLEPLEKIFPIVSLYSQRLPPKTIEKIIQPLSLTRDKIRNEMGKFLLKIDKNSNFYKLHLQNTIIKIDKKIEDLNKRVSNIERYPTEYHEGDNPLFLVAVCHKQKKKE